MIPLDYPVIKYTLLFVLSIKKAKIIAIKKAIIRAREL
jgi:hypothetical protein